MEKERVKLIVRNMELLLNQLKLELQDDADDYVLKVADSLNQDYDEIFEEDE